MPAPVPQTLPFSREWLLPEPISPVPGARRVGWGKIGQIPCSVTGSLEPSVPGAAPADPQSPNNQLSLPQPPTTTTESDVGVVQPNSRRWSPPLRRLMLQAPADPASGSPLQAGWGPPEGSGGRRRTLRAHGADFRASRACGGMGHTSHGAPWNERPWQPDQGSQSTWEP